MAYINGQEVLFSPRIGAGLSVDEVRELCTEVSVQKIIDLCFPVGVIIQCANSPAQTIGGTWERIKDKFLLASGDTYTVGATGGSADAVIPQHNHLGLYYNAISEERRTGWENGTSSGNYYMQPSYSVGNASDNNFVTGEVESRATNATVTQDATGKNMPPYIAVNTWKRIA